MWLKALNLRTKIGQSRPSLFNWVPLSSTPPSVQHISSTQKGHSFSAPKSLSSTPKTPQFNTTPSVPHKKARYKRQKRLYKAFLCGTEGVELRGFRCGTEGGGTEGFLVWNWGVCVELRGFWCGTEGFWGWKGVALLCGTDVLNWGGCGTEGDPRTLCTLIFMGRLILYHFWSRK